MTISSPNCLTVFILIVSLSLPLLLLLPSSASAARLSFSAKVVSDDIRTQICSKSEDKTYCSQFMKSIPDANNLHDLAQTIIGVSHNKSDENHRTFESLISQTSDPELKKRYTACSNDFSQASDSLLKGGVSFQSGKFVEASTAAKVAATETHNCEDEFNTSPFMPSYLQQRTQQFETVCGVIQISIQLLLKQN
ncbi:hypothetical protein M5689_023640 [Euphorbia peplus]|nr:hypothetical protein M5689_023640 [Euphorbia peplus]